MQRALQQPAAPCTANAAGCLLARQVDSSQTTVALAHAAQTPWLVAGSCCSPQTEAGVRVSNKRRCANGNGATNSAAPACLGKPELLRGR